MRRTQVLLAMALCLLPFALSIPAQSSAPVGDLLMHYADWAQGRGDSIPIVAPDLDVARAELNRIAPIFLVPLEGTVGALKGVCPEVTFGFLGARGASVVTNARTTFEGGNCAQIANGSKVKVLRGTQAALPAMRVVLEMTGELDSAAALQSAVTAAVAPKTPEGPDEDQRRLIATFALELAAIGAKTQFSAAARLVEWACPLVRSHKPINEFDHAWQLAALAILESGIDTRVLAAHLDHAEAFLEPRQVLARGIVEEQASAPAEAGAGQPNAMDVARATLLTGGSAERARMAERAIAQFQIAAKDERLRAEANIRMGHVQLEMGRYDDALAAFANVERVTSDRALIYLANLFRGLAYDGRERAGDARAAYQDALAVSPGAHAATMRLAALTFRNGDAAHADALLSALLRDDDPRRDAWWSYYAADWRFWYSRIDGVRRLVGRAGDRKAVDDPAMASNTNRAMTSSGNAATTRVDEGSSVRLLDPAAVPPPASSIAPSSPSPDERRPVFRSTVDAVTIQVSVRNGARPVGALTAADFSLLDNGVPQQISSVSVEHVPVDLTVLLDSSVSVDGALLQRLKVAVRDTAGLLRNDDRIRLVSVSHMLKELFSLRPRGETMSLDALAGEGATSLYDGLAAAMMRPSEPGRRQLVLAFTDGRDSSSIIDEAAVRQVARLTDATVDIVVPIVDSDRQVPTGPANYGSSGTPIGSSNIVTGTSTVEMAGRARALQPWARRDQVPLVLTDLVTPTAGQVFPLEVSGSIGGVFKKMLDEFRASYVLQYMPQGVSPAGWHDVTVTVTKPGKFDIRARKGYSGVGEESPLTDRRVR